MSKKKRQPPKPPPKQPPKQLPKQSPKPPQRTTLMMVAIVLVILHGLLWAAIAFASRPETGEGLRLYNLGLLGLTAIADVIAGVAMWYWKRWGIYLFVVSAILTAVSVLIHTGSAWIMFGSILPPIIVLYILNTRQQSFA